MATIKLDNVAATASITIQLIKDYSMYSSEIISSNGTIFQSTDTSTTLTLRVYKGVEDITNKITDIVWSKFFFDDEELKEDYNWGLDKRNQKKITLYKDDIEEKSIIQASGYSMIEGHRELVTTARITMIKISDVYISDITPVNPSNNMMWMDTNCAPPVLKLWNADDKVWISSGTDIPIVKNVIKNSNFWADIDDYFEIKNSSHIVAPVRILDQNKYWVTLRSKNANSQSGGISQKIQYPITANSNYIFSLIGFIESNLYSKSLTIKIDSIDENNRITTIVEEDMTLETNITSESISFKTLDSTKELEVYILTKNKSNCYCHITELSLYNSSVYYPWEPCPEDIDKQVNSKLDNNRLSVFNTLMNNGSFRAIYESENQYYIRAEYIVPELAKQSNLNTLIEQVNTLQSKYKKDIADLNSKITELENRIKILEEDNSSGEEPEEPNEPTS